MTESDSPREIGLRLLDGITSGEWDRLADLYADDVVVEMPFRPPRPGRIVGRDAVHRHFMTVAQGRVELTASNVVVHETGDPEVVILEWDYDGRVTATGRTFRCGNVQVLRVRDGKIAASRDYHDHLTIAAALDQLDQIVGAAAS